MEINEPSIAAQVENAMQSMTANMKAAATAEANAASEERMFGAGGFVETLTAALTTEFSGIHQQLARQEARTNALQSATATGFTAMATRVHAGEEDMILITETMGDVLDAVHTHEQTFSLQFQKTQADLEELRDGLERQAIALRSLDAEVRQLTEHHNAHLHEEAQWKDWAIQQLQALQRGPAGAEAADVRDLRQNVDEMHELQQANLEEASEELRAAVGEMRTAMTSVQDSNTRPRSNGKETCKR
jgi:hypothetical protein